MRNFYIALYISSNEVLIIYAKFQGLWMGLICGLACQATTLLIITLRIKWTKSNVTMQDEEHEHHELPVSAI